MFAHFYGLSHVTLASGCIEFIKTSVLLQSQPNLPSFCHNAHNIHNLAVNKETIEFKEKKAVPSLSKGHIENIWVKAPRSGLQQRSLCLLFSKGPEENQRAGSIFIHF